MKKEYSGDPILNNIPEYKNLTPKSKKTLEKALKNVLMKWYVQGKATTSKERINSQMIRSKNEKGEIKSTTVSSLLKEILPHMPTAITAALKTKNGVIEPQIHPKVKKTLNEELSTHRGGARSVKKRIAGLNMDNPPIVLKKVMFFPHSEIESIFTPDLTKKLKRKIKTKKIHEWGPSKLTKDHEWLSKWEKKKIREMKRKK